MSSGLLLEPRALTLVLFVTLANFNHRVYFFTDIKFCHQALRPCCFKYDCHIANKFHVQKAGTHHDGNADDANDDGKAIILWHTFVDGVSPMAKNEQKHFCFYLRPCVLNQKEIMPFETVISFISKQFSQSAHQKLDRLVPIRLRSHSFSIQNKTRYFKWNFLCRGVLFQH